MRNLAKQDREQGTCSTSLSLMMSEVMIEIKKELPELVGSDLDARLLHRRQCQEGWKTMDQAKMIEMSKP